MTTTDDHDQSGTGTDRTVEDVIEHAKEQVESSAASAAKYDGEQGAFFAGVRAAYAGIVEEFGDDGDFEEVLKRGSEAKKQYYEDDDDV